jgi:hypothetical protein
MEIPYTFDSKTTEAYINRIEKLTPETQALWGKMDVAQMLAHISIAYDMTYGKINLKYNVLTKGMLKLLVKKMVVSDKPYKKNNSTAPVFKIADKREFETEKKILIDYIKLTESKGESHFEGLENTSFGKMTAKEGSNLFSKHMDHHLKQVGV